MSAPYKPVPRDYDALSVLARIRKMHDSPIFDNKSRYTIESMTRDGEYYEITWKDRTTSRIKIDERQD